MRRMRRPGSMRRVSCAGVLAAASLVAGVPSAGAYPLPDSIDVTVSPATVSYPVSPATTFSVNATSGGTGANFGVSWRAASVWSGPQNILSGPTMGWPLGFSPPSLVGPGAIRQIYAPVVVFQSARSGPAAPGAGSCLRGASAGPGIGYWVEMPPNASSSIAIPVALSAAPYPGTDLTTSFDLIVQDDINSLHTPLITHNLGAVGLSGVDIRLRLLHKFSFTEEKDRMPAIAGTTNPPLPNTRVSLRAIRVKVARGRPPLDASDWKGKGTEPLGSTRTNGAGRFQIEKQPFERNGLFRIVARLKKPPPGYVADWACGQTLEFLAPGEDPY